MGRERRAFEADGICHFTARGSDRRAIVHDDRDRHTILAILAGVAERYGWDVIAYCVMSNHYHMLMSAADPAAVSPGMRELNGGYARTYNKRYGRDAHVFRNRFAAHPIETDEHLLAAARYVVLNPVRAGICSRPGDWRWSSYRPTAGLAPKPSFLSVERLLGAIDPRAEVARAIYRRMVADAVSDTVTNV